MKLEQLLGCMSLVEVQPKAMPEGKPGVDQEITEELRRDAHTGTWGVVVGDPLDSEKAAQACR